MIHLYHIMSCTLFRVNKIDSNETFGGIMYHIKNDKRSRTTSLLLYKALCQLLDNQSLENITITQLTEHAQVGRATFYRNFDTIDDILRYAVDQHFIALKDYLYDYYSKTPDFSMHFFIIPFLKYWDRDYRLIEILMDTKNLWLLYESFQKLLKESLETYFSSSHLHMENMDYFIAFRTGIAVNLLIQWIKNDRQDAPEKIVEILRTHIDGTKNYKMFVEAYPVKPKTS